MPIAIACACGKSAKVKDEFAGKKVRCPSCSQTISVPYVVAVEEAAPSPVTVKPRRAVPPPLPKEAPPKRPPVYEVDSDLESPDESPLEERPRRAKKKRKKSFDRKSEKTSGRRIVFEEGWFGSVNSGVIGGLIMIVIAIVWFGLGFAAGRIFFYPPILGVIGVIAVLKGLLGGE